MAEEMSSHSENRTWKLVPPTIGRRIMQCRWLYKIKPETHASPARFKARLVVKRFQQVHGLDYEETFASVCRCESLRLLLAIIVSEGLVFRQFDVKTAFLDGQLEEIFMTQPEEYEQQPTEVCRLLKGLYGLKQAPRCWSQTFSAFAKTICLSPLHSDPCVYSVMIENEKVHLILYVDDGLVIARTFPVVDHVLQALHSSFEIKVSDPSVYVGMEIECGSGHMVLTQRAYIRSVLEKFGMADSKPTNVPARSLILELLPAQSSDPKYPYRELIGSLPLAHSI